jgi:hypothetical protein
MTDIHTADDAYVTDDASAGWHLMLGDSYGRLAVPGGSIDLSLCSPPFASLYTYSPAATWELLDARRLRITTSSSSASSCV